MNFAKPLEWVFECPGKWFARTPLNEAYYAVWQYRDEPTRWAFGTYGESVEADSIEAAKNACEADWQSKIRSVIDLAAITKTSAN